LGCDVNFESFESFFTSNVAIFGIISGYSSVGVSCILWAFLLVNANKKSKCANGLKIIASIHVLNGLSSLPSIFLGALLAKIFWGFKMETSDPSSSLYGKITNIFTGSVLVYSVAKSLYKVFWKTVYHHLPGIFLAILVSKFVAAGLRIMFEKKALFQGLFFADDKKVINGLGISVSTLIIISNNSFEIKMLSTFVIGSVLYINNTHI
jgi:hypothetical protein